MLVKVADFGTYGDTSTPLINVVGTVGYVPEEVLKQEGYQGPPVDIFALGVILFVMLTAQVPFHQAGDSLHKGFLNKTGPTLKKRKITMEKEA